MAEKLTEPQLSHPANEKLLQQATLIGEERTTLEERLRRLESNRNGVSAAVFEKVRGDYVQKLEENKKRFEAIRGNLDQELVALTEKKLLVEENKKGHTETLEEAKLRQSLGEFGVEESEKVSKAEGEEVKRLDAALQKLGADLGRFEQLLKKRPVTPAPSKAPEKPTATGSAPSIATDRQKPVDLESTSRVKLEAKKPAQLVVTESGKPAQTVTLDRTITIGRSPANELVLAEAKVSRQHAQIQVLGDKYVLLDLESSNGTFIGDKKITEHLLSPGDEIRIGKTTLVFKV